MLGNFNGPFVYRLVLKIFILARGVRFPYGLLQFKKKKTEIMAYHKSSLKRIRQTEVKRLHNRYYAKTTRNAIKVLRNTTNKEEAVKMYPEVVSMIDKLAKRNVIHKNKAANLKSKLALQVNKL